ncbi:succinate dehydrogenase [Epidermidibacterium keratini]|uniref:Succinate dehydrogenase n=1 Tax=Epidermidibacterium keratini TaxID=1891644 RepID=A0A7L4YLI9_9ACTN|nr:succinate dehydrogenase cytochrome b subunit [Epidermidibacterium keratini]QHB99732.1 succinate dehydrogenase [Epidermidibacterium keratini]
MATTTDSARANKASRTTVFLKLLMATSGALFVLYVIVHMYGNLKALSGQQAFDEYAESLRTLLMPILPYGGFLWLFRALLIVALVAHLYSAFKLWSRANNARPVKYAAKKAASAAVRAKWMRWGGVALLAFVIFHLLQFTIVKFNVNSNVSDASIDDSPYRLLHASFQVWWVVLIYVIALIALGLHLFHGIWSASQTMGWTDTPMARRNAKTVAAVIALVVSVGFVIPPVAILFGLGS